MFHTVTFAKTRQTFSLAPQYSNIKELAVKYDQIDSQPQNAC